MVEPLFDLAPAEPSRDKPTASGSMFDLAPPSAGKTAAPTTGGKLLSNAPEDDDAGGLRGAAKNLASATLTGASTLAGGMAGDTVEAARRLAAGFTSLGGDRTTRQILEEWDATRDKANQKRIESMRTAQKPSWSTMSDAQWEAARKRKIAELEVNHGAPATTENVYEHSVAPKVGTYTPTSRWGEYGHAMVAGAVPGAIAGPLGVAAGVLSGATGEAMNKSDANPFWSTAVPLIVGGATPLGAKGAGVARRGVLGKNAAEQKQAAAELLAAQSDDPKAAYKLAQERAGMPDETLAESTVRGDTGDQGLARTQDALLTARQPEMVEANQRLQAGRQAAMSDTLGKIAPDSQPGDVSASLHQHLEQINAAADAAPQPTASTADIGGGNLRDAGQTRRNTVMGALDTLKKTIDPDGRMGTWTGDLNDFARSKLQDAESRPLKAEIGPVAQEYFDTASKLKDVTKFNDLIDFDQNITAGLKKTRDTDPAGHGVLLELKREVKKAINNSIENQHKWDQSDIGKGTLAPEESLAHRLQRERDDFLARKKAAASAERATGTGPADITATGDVPPAVGAGPSGPGAAGGADGVPGSAPLEPMSGDAASRLSLFNKGYGTAKDTFDKGPVGKALETEFGGKSKQMNAEVAQKAFAPGPKGYETAQMWLAAGGPEGLASLKDIATNRLQAELKGGKPLDQKALDAWKTKHTDALRAIDEAEAKVNPGQNIRFSDQFDDAAGARQIVQNFESSAAAKFLGQAPDDVVNHISGLMKGKDSTPLRDLVQQAEKIDGAPDGPIVNGMRRAGAQWLQDNFEQSGIRSIRDLLANHRNALEALFDKDAVSNMDKVNDSIDKSATVQALANRNTPGSQTAPREQAIAKLQAQLKATAGHDTQSGVLNTTNALVIFELLSHIGRSAMAGDLRAVVGGSLGLAGTLLVKPMLERALEKRGAQSQANITRMLGQGFASREVGAAMLKQVIDENGKPNQLAIDTLADALIGAETSTQQKRQGHAGGGGVFDHKAAAKHMVGMVDKARKRDSEGTKPLLQAHDNMVAHALAIANRSI